MSIAKGGLGRGVESLYSPNIISTDLKNVSKDEIKNISIDKIQANPNQPRKIFSEISLEELAMSIKNQGIIQPLIVRIIDKEKYEIIAGERRYKASKLAGIKELPVIIRDYNDKEALTIALIENLQRENLNPIDEAKAYFELKELHKISQEELAEKLGKSRSAVVNSIRLLSLPDFIKEAIIVDELKPSHGRCLVSIEDANDQRLLYENILKDGLNVREVENALKYWNENKKLPDFMYADANAVIKENSIKVDKNKEKSEFIRELELQLKNKISYNLSVKGNEKRGSIKISYRHPDELNMILDNLGI